MGPPKEVTPSFRNAINTSPGVPLRGVAASVRMVCVDDFTKSSLSVQRLFVYTMSVSKRYRYQTLL